MNVKDLNKTSSRQGELPDATAPLSAGKLQKVSIASYFALGISLVEGVCSGLLFFKGLALALGVFGLMAATAGSWIHADAIRIPALTLAGIAALVNLYVVWNGFRLRRSPAAQWRIRPLTSSERARIVLVTGFAFLTLILIASEVYAHHVLEHA